MAPSAQAGPDVEQPRAPQRENEHRAVGGPLEQVVDELEQPAVGPLEVLEHEHDRRLVRHSLEEQPPAAEQVGAVGGGPLLEAQQVGQPWLDEPALALVGHELVDGRASFARAVAGPSSSAIPARARTISASAQ